MLLRECNLCYDYDPPAPSNFPPVRAGNLGGAAADNHP